MQVCHSRLRRIGRGGWSRSVVAAAGAVLFSAATLATGAPAQAAAPAGGGLVMTRLTGDVLPGLAKATNLGPAPAGTRVEVVITMTPPNQSAERAAYTAMYTPGNPAFHHFLTPAQFSARFGVSSATYAAVERWATAQGLGVVLAPSDRFSLTLAGTPAQVDRTFAVTEDNFRNNGLTYYANTAAPTVPANLGIAGVIGLDDFLRSVTTDHLPAASAPHGTVADPRPAQSLCESGTCVGLTTPQDLWGIYDLPGTNLAAEKPTDNFGEGQQMAVFGEGQTAGPLADLRAFEALNGLPQIPVTVVHTDGPTADYSDNSGSTEWDIDSQASTGMSPNALREVWYFGSSLTDASVLSAMTTWVNDPTGPLQANASYGECEYSTVGAAAGVSAGAAYQAASEQNLAAANMEGRTLFSSAGDTGSSCPILPADTNGVANQAYPQPNYPADSPHAVDVGGTVLYGTNASPDTRALEYAWTFTGGGGSLDFPEPSYQTGVSTIALPCGPTADGGYGGTGTCRGVPDVAAQSGDIASNGYAIVAGGTADSQGAGTSLASPLWMGMWTRVQAAAPAVTVNGNATYPGLGFANPTLYKIGTNTAQDPTAFFDIGGPTQSEPSGNGYFTALPRSPADPSGWDYVSGFGSPDITQIALFADGKTAPSNDVLPAYPSSGGSGGATVPADVAACYPLFTAPPGGDSYQGNSGGNPQLDVIQGDMHVSANGQDLQAILTMSNMSTAMASPGGGAPGATANEYYMKWSYTPPATAGGSTPATTSYFANAEVAATGSVTYSDGTVSGSQFTTVHSNDTGSIVDGKDGTVEIDVPLANIGSPTTGGVLVAPAAATYALVGAPTNPTGVSGGSLQPVDSAGPQYNFVLGEHCGATGLPGSSGGGTAGPGPSVPESPLAVLLPLLGLLGAGAVVMRRRRGSAGRSVADGGGPVVNGLGAPSH
jgi:pseudomonalisin